jgi:hypothetical protein
VEFSVITPHEANDTQLEAVIKMNVACRLVLESLPMLPRETQAALREPTEVLCEVSERELDRLQPGWDNSSERP